jgi:glycosyltransferase involved in cell wall biosynthesis
MGNLGEYGEMIRLAIEESLNILEVRIEVSGRRTTWDSEFENKVQQLGIWHGFLPDNKLRSWLDSADVFLVAMRFEKQFRRFMETSFPSKILEYAQFHKPIIVWGPKYCSAVRWAQESGAALCVTDPDPSSLVEVLRNLSTEERSQLGSKAGEVAAAEFNPTKIQKQFLNAIENAARVSNSGG